MYIRKKMKTSRTYQTLYHTERLRKTKNMVCPALWIKRLKKNVHNPMFHVVPVQTYKSF
jgi:hypothetical protein